MTRDPRLDPRKGDVIRRTPIGRGSPMRIIVVNRTDLRVDARKTTRRNVVGFPIWRWRDFAANADVVKVARVRKKAARAA